MPGVLAVLFRDVSALLLVVLTQQEADVNAEVQAVTRKRMNWIAHHGATPGKDRDRLLPLHQYLDQPGLGNDLEEINYYCHTYRLSARQKLLRNAQKRKDTYDLNHAVMSLPRRFPLSRPRPTGAVLRSLDTGQLTRFLVFTPD